MAVRLWAGRVYKDRGDRWFIRLNDGTRIYCNLRQETFYSRQAAERCLATEIQPEIGKPSFDITFWQKTKKSVKSFQTYSDEWFANCEARLARKALSPGYVREIRRYLKAYFLPFFGEMDLQEIRGHDLTRFYNSLVGLSEKTTYNIMAVSRKFLRDAYFEEVIPAMPRFPRLSLGPEPQTLWADEEQLAEIFKFLSLDDYYFILFAYAHACRTGEVRALQHRDIDLEHDLVIIRRAFSGTTLRETTKTKRIVPKPLDPEWKRLYLSRPRVLDPKGFVFCATGNHGQRHGQARNSKKRRQRQDIRICASKTAPDTA